MTAALLLIGAATLPRAAYAQRFGGGSWTRAASAAGAGHRNTRPIALEIHGLLDINPRPAPALSQKGWWARPGSELRLFLGLPNGFTELSLNFGWLGDAPGRGGTWRPSLGLSANLPIGRNNSLYGLATTGLWINRRTVSDAWGPSLALESRAAVGGRFQVMPGVSMVAEFGISTLTVGAGNFDPVLGLHLGWSLAPARKGEETSLNQGRPAIANRAPTERKRPSTSRGPSSPERSSEADETLSPPPLPHLD